MKQIIMWVMMMILNAVLVLGIRGQFGENTTTKAAFLVALVSLIAYFICREWEVLAMIAKYTFREESAEDEEEEED